MATAVATANAAGIDEPTRWQRAFHWIDLTWVLAKKNFRQRYLRSKLGVLWALIQPLVQAAVLSFVFLKIFKVHRVPHYPLYVLSGIMSWGFFQQATVGGTTAVVDNAALVRKVAVPKVIFPISVVGGVLIVFSMQVVILLVGGLVIGTVGVHLPLLLLAVALETMLATGIAILCCAIHVSIRDVRFLVESVLIMAFYLTPVLYDPSKLSPKFASILQYNPMFGVLSLTRAALLSRPINWTAVGISAAIAVGVLAISLPVFRAQSADFADLV
jgi:ABC-type polysaccharide/polyol phosphate export permease